MFCHVKMVAGSWWWCAGGKPRLFMNHPDYDQTLICRPSTALTTGLAHQS